MKKHRVNRIMTFILVLALSVSTLLIGCGKNNDKIVLGWIGPLTGENTIWGTAEMQALTMAVEDTNAAGGLLGKEVELKTYDNRGDAVETTNAAKKAIQQDGCIALFGCNTSACAIALSEVCTQFNIPQIATTATNSKLTQDDDGTVHPYTFRVCLSDPQMGDVMAQYAYKEMGLRSVAIIYESRPNVTADAFGLTFKSGNACILRGGSDSINSNIAIADVIAKALYDNGINPDVINLIKDTDRALVNQLMKMNDYIDVIIPRGGAGLIKNVVNNSTVPVIETGTGNCHVYVDEYADIDMAVKVIYNAKTSRIGVCNACESLVIHKAVAKQAIPLIVNALKEKNVEVRGDEYAMQCDSRIVPASDDDWGMEYLDYIISVKTVDSVDEAIEHINTYNTGHSESIITKDYNNANRFLDEIDAACVYVNASTRFSDGFEFGFGAEIGISTQKLHARGPMGLKALTTTKYVIYGEGQIRQ